MPIVCLMDNTHNLAFDLNAPADERAAAMAELTKEYLPTESDLSPHKAQINAALEELQQDTMFKAMSAGDVPHPSLALQENKPGMKSKNYDQFYLSPRGDYWERPSGLSFDFLRGMVQNTPILNAIVMTRTRQVQRFARVCQSDTSLPGFQITHVDRDHSPTKSELEKMKEINRFISNCGFEFSARQRKKLKRDSFTQFLGKITRDTLILDSVGIETEMKNNRNLGMDGFYAVDGATIRLCSERGYGSNPDLFAVQVVGGLVSTAYSYDDLIYEPRNARSDVMCGGYGLSESELLIRVVTYFINAMMLNGNVFDKNSIPKGILHAYGNFDNAEIAAFKRMWSNMVRGVNNSLNLPVLVSKDKESAVNFEKFGVDFSEMMFAKFMTFLTSLACAIYGMSPSEINFDSFTGGSTSALSGSDTAEKLAASKDSGLRPLLAYNENLFTDYIVSEFNPDYCFRFTGLDVEDEGQKLELRKTVLTLNELRAEEGYEKIKDPIGDAPIDPNLLNAWMQMKAQAQAEQAQPEDDQGQGNQDQDQEKNDLKKAFDDLHKAHDHGGGSDDDIFAQHPNAFIRPIVEDYTQKSMFRVSEIRSSLMRWLDGKNYAAGKPEPMPSGLNYLPTWTDEEAARVELYLTSKIPETFTVNDMALLSKLLVRQYLPTNVLIDEVVNEAAQSFIMGAAQAAWQGAHPDQEPTDMQVAAIREVLPTTLEGVLNAMRLSTTARASLDYGTQRAAENIVQLTDDIRGRIQGVLTEHYAKKAAGDNSATAGKLQQTLLEKFGDMNRDWRRISLTELNEMKLQGFVGSQPSGTKLQRLERDDGCQFCKKINKMIVTVVDPDKPDKDGDTEIWQGKTNIGRSGSPNKRTENGLEPRMKAELWWVPAGNVHPHCRGDWIEYIDMDNL